MEHFDILSRPWIKPVIQTLANWSVTLGHAFRGDLDLDSPGATWMLSISTLIWASVWWICTDLQHESEGKLIFWSLVSMSWIFKFPQSLQQLQALEDTQFLIDVSLAHWLFIGKHQGHVVKNCQRRFKIKLFFNLKHTVNGSLKLGLPSSWHS